jgi:CRP/FNR family transcriptional regulator, nitrogen oxide reductase regulator
VNCKCTVLANRKLLDLPPNLRPRLFEGLTRSELSAVLSEAIHRRFPENSVILHEEDPADRLFLLMSGQGKQFVLTRDGRKIILNWLTAGQAFGGATMVNFPSRYLASTEVESGSCALLWERKTIRELIFRVPKILDNAFSIAVTENVAWLVGARVSLSTDNAQSRIAHLLLSLACGVGKTGPEGIEISVGNEDLASGASVTPFTVSRILSSWQREGILRKKRGKVILEQPEYLAASNLVGSNLVPC